MTYTAVYHILTSGQEQNQGKMTSILTHDSTCPTESGYRHRNLYHSQFLSMLQFRLKIERVKTNITSFEFNRYDINQLSISTIYHMTHITIDTPSIHVNFTTFLGLTAQRSSNGFMVDNTPPVFTSRAEISEAMGSMHENTQVPINLIISILYLDAIRRLSRCLVYTISSLCIYIYILQLWGSYLSVRWTVADLESPVMQHYLSIITRSSLQLGLPTVQVIK